MWSLPSIKKFDIFLTDILDAIDKIFLFAEGMDYDAFLNDEKTREAVARKIEIIGEAAKNVPDKIKIKYSDIDWKGIIGMRIKLSHEYFGISWIMVWETIQKDLKPLKDKVLEILKEETAEESPDL